MMGNQIPILLLKEGTKRERGRGAQSSNITAAKAIAEAIRTTLGPKGMDKMMVDSMGDVVITNDGVTILKEMEIEHPAAKMIVEVAKTQDEQCGDGTTTAVVIAGEFLKRAEDLLEQNVHSTIIAHGYKLASERALEVLERIAIDIDVDDKEMLKKIASTAMTGKSAEAEKEHLSEVVVEAVRTVAEKRDGKWIVDQDNIKIEKKHGGSVRDTKMIQGLIIDKERVHSGMPEMVKDAKIALVDSALEVKKTEVDAKINITDPSQLQKFLAEEENMLRRLVEKVESAGANVLFCQKGIDDLAQHFLAKKKIFAIRRVKKSDMTKLAKATGARVVSNLDDLTAEDLGSAGKIEELKIGDDEMTYITECVNPKAVSILIRGGTEHIVDQVERTLDDGISVVALAIEDGKAVAGGGSPEIEIALDLEKYATTMEGREQLAIKAYATAIEIIPKTLAENAGMDAINAIVNLRSAHETGKRNSGLSSEKEEVIDMLENNVIEPLRVKTQAIESATEVAVMLLRIDDVIASKGSEMPAMPPGGGGMGGMPEY